MVLPPLHGARRPWSRLPWPGKLLSGGCSGTVATGLKRSPHGNRGHRRGGGRARAAPRQGRAAGFARRGRDGTHPARRSRRGRVGRVGRGEAVAAAAAGPGWAASSECDPRTASRMTRFRLPASGFRLPASGFRLPASGFRLPASGFRLPASGFRLPASGFRLPASGFRLPASGFRLLIVLSRASAARVNPPSGLADPLSCRGRGCAIPSRVAVSEHGPSSLDDGGERRTPLGIACLPVFIRHFPANRKSPDRLGNTARVAGPQR